MRKISRRSVLRAAAAIPAAALLGDAAAADPLYAGFQDPPMSARPFVRWWWNGNKLTAAEIVRELDLLKAAGMGGVEINPIRFPNPDDPLNIPALECFSEAWARMYEVAVRAAKERGMTADSIVGSGWPFGGRFLEPEERTQIVSLGTRRVRGPATITLSESDLFKETELRLTSKNDAIDRRVYHLRLVPAQMKQFQQGTDVTEHFQNGELRMDVPDGEYALYILVVQRGFGAVINGAPGADGPVLNHFNAQAVGKYLDHVSNSLEPVLGRLGEWFRAMFCDSMELEGANWCSDLPQEFRARRGYAMEPYLPFVLFKTAEMGNAVADKAGAELGEEAQAEVERARYDFLTTLIELFNDRFTRTFRAWCNAHGVKARAQAYGPAYHPLESSLLVDIPECETWMNPQMHMAAHRAPTGINKFVSSAARFSGKRLVSCEELTNTGMVFNATLASLKICGDQSNLSGVTHSIFHGFNYSPKEAAFPGWVRYGTFFNERNPWWPYVRRWTDYKARISSVFQNCDARANVAILHPFPDLWMKHGLQRDPFPVVKMPAYQFSLWEAVHQSGSGCDYVSERLLAESKSAAGRLNVSGRGYDAVLAMEAATVEPATAQALERFADAGGKIIFIGNAPSRSPRLQQAQKNDALVRAASEGILKKHAERCAVVDAPGEDLLGWYAGVESRFGIKPFVRIEKPQINLSQIAFTQGARELFFFVNSGIEGTAETLAEFDTGRKTPWQWNPETGERFAYPFEGARNQLRLRIEPGGSLLLVFEPTLTGAPRVTARPSEDGGLALGGPWQLRLQHVSGERKEITLDELVDFKNDERLRSFAGEAVYEKSFAGSGGFHFLDLGAVQGISAVTLNGADVGMRWYGRHCYDVADKLRSGQNQLTVRVTTVLGNYCKSLTSNRVAQQWTARQAWQSAGMMGPVRLLRG
jgi:hypothetical protein